MESIHTTINTDKQTADTIRLIANRTGKKQTQILNEVFDKLLWLVSSMDLTKDFELEYEFDRTENKLIVTVHGKPNLQSGSFDVDSRVPNAQVDRMIREKLKGVEK